MPSKNAIFQWSYLTRMSKNGSFVPFRTQIFCVLTGLVGWLFLFSLVWKNGVIQHKPNYTSGSDRILCDEAGLNSIAGRNFVYNGTHCQMNYRDTHLVDVFEAHRSEWAHFGRTQAWWSVSTDDRWKSMKDIPSVYKDESYKSSRAEQADFSDRLSEFPPNKRERALDFGSGVGRLSVMLHQKMGYTHVIGVDQSVWHARIARTEMERLNLQNHVEFLVSGPNLMETLGGVKFDLVISMIALQHMVPPLMVVYIEQFCDVLEFGGYGYFQVPTKLVADYSQFKCSFEWSIQEGGMQVWYLESDQIHHVLQRRGCHVLKQYEMDAIGIPHSKSELFFFSKTRMAQ